MRRPTAFLHARFALLWERAAPVLILPFAALGLYLALAAYGVFDQLGDPWRLICLVSALGTSIAWVRWQAPQMRWPIEAEIERRIEDDSGLTDRPFEALRDTPAVGDSQMWTVHTDRMKARLIRARARRPKAAWARLDPYGLRVGLIVMLVTGGFLAGDLLGLRLSDAFAPRLLTGGGQDAMVDVWIEPPAYTGRPTQFLLDRREAESPEGSVLVVRIAGINRAPRILGAPAQTETLSDGVHLIRIQPEASGEITIRAGALREHITLSLIEDAPPRLTFAAEPEGDAQGRLGLEYVAEDDYGLETVALEYALAPDADSIMPEDGYEIYVFSPGELSEANANGVRTANLDMSRSKFAGQRVVIRLAGVDGAGQRGISGEMSFTLPQRIFLDPLARAVAAERQRFLQVQAPYAPMPERADLKSGFLDDQPARRLDRAPREIQRLALALNAASDAPTHYFDDAIVWMGLRTALNEVRRAREHTDLSHMEADLWDIALRAELGSLADAEAALQAAERALSDALARGADPIELSALFDAFEQAMANYVQLLARQAAEAGRFASGGGGQGGMDSDFLQELLDALREAAELGDSAGSRRALAQLAELLRNMQVQLGGGAGQGFGGGAGGGESAMAQALREALEELSNAITDQRELMEDTFNAEQSAREGEQDGSGEPSLQDLADPQSDLADMLDGQEPAMSGGEGAEEMESALNGARDAMENASRALRQGQGQQALAYQDEALSQLRSASRAAAQAIERELADNREDEGRDPLGRGGAREGDATLPSEAERQRARDILEELRRRAAERNRPQEELDYIDRLLERF